MKQLGVTPMILPINRTMDAPSEGQVDGVIVIPAVLSWTAASAHHHELMDKVKAEIAKLRKNGQ